MKMIYRQYMNKIQIFGVLLNKIKKKKKKIRDKNKIVKIFKIKDNKIKKKNKNLYKNLIMFKMWTKTSIIQILLIYKVYNNNKNNNKMIKIIQP